MLDSSIIFPDSEALIQIKEGGRKKYLRAFNQLRDFIGDQLESRPPTEHELLKFLRHLREEKGMASSSLWTIYSMINSVSKGKYSFSLKQYCRVTILLKSFDIDIKQKANVFSTSNIQQFLLDADSSTPYWIVRKTIVCLAYYGGLRHTEMMDIQIELCESTSEGIYVTHSRAKQRSDKRSSRFLVPRTDDSRSADIVDQYIGTIKEKLGKFTGRLLWTGNAKFFINQPMGRNMVAKVPSDMAERLQLDTPGGYTFHSYRRSAATAVADAGATSEQMRDFFGWANTNMTAEYISTSKAAVINVANKLAASEKTIATSPVSTTVEEVAVVDKEKEITTVELNRGDESEELWDEWPGDVVVNQTEVVTHQQSRVSSTRNIRETVPMKIESGGKVFYLSNCTFENFTC